MSFQCLLHFVFKVGKVFFYFISEKIIYILLVINLYLLLPFTNSDKVNTSQYDRLRPTAELE